MIRYRKSRCHIYESPYHKSVEEVAQELLDDGCAAIYCRRGYDWYLGIDPNKPNVLIRGSSNFLGGFEEVTSWKDAGLRNPHLTSKADCQEYLEKNQKHILREVIYTIYNKKPWDEYRWGTLSTVIYSLS